MKTKIKLILCITFLFNLTIATAQVNFDTTSYNEFLNSTKNMLFDDLIEMYPLKHQYYKGMDREISIWDHLYLDSIVEKFELTEDEITKLETNYFVVSERLSYGQFANALDDVYVKDMPVFLSTDAILQALHSSYDKLLQNLELYIMSPNLELFIDSLYFNVPELLEKYNNDTTIQKSLEDVDLYTTIAYSLINDSLYNSHLINQEKVIEIWDYIQNETMVSISLFVNDSITRLIDFSQFKVRGHYVDNWEVLEGWRASLEPYFKTMMWLGRIDFLLTQPPQTLTWTDNMLKRTNISACLLNELIELSENKELLQQNNNIINYLVGESDNLTSNEFEDILTELHITDATQILNDSVFNNLQTTLFNSYAESGQRILSSIFIVNPFSSEPDILPVSYKLSGQRFILDSYILSNVVYDRIIYEDHKVVRLMPDPLDAMFVLGNENALPLLEDEISIYPYSSQLAGLRYLVDSYTDEYWETNLYSTWLGAIKKLVTPNELTNYPVFMKTAAWQQEKLNTQLASWTQLRHDNLLYAKPSYTGVAMCNYPHSFVEPNPEFYNLIAIFADNAGTFFNDLGGNFSHAGSFFSNFKETMNKLKIISEKELNGEAFDETEIDFLKNMLVEGNEDCSPPYEGWYPYLYYDMYEIVNKNFLIADIHTQPSDSSGNMVGKVLHAAVGKVNLGIFLAKSPSYNNRPMAFIGPVMSYYEKITGGFYRMTDEEWSTMVESNNVPARPDWVNIYLTDKNGDALPNGRELPSIVYVNNEEPKNNVKPVENVLVYPNPTNRNAKILIKLQKESQVTINVFDNQGKFIKTLSNKKINSGIHLLTLKIETLPNGIYLCKINTNQFSVTKKIVKLE
ncbi:MAG: DUF3160 domain-containing protein [Chlorobi bacterium]|nr:DUF3160 domain-containing protein [Chlorobiota bacterium]